MPKRRERKEKPGKGCHYSDQDKRCRTESSTRSQLPELQLQGSDESDPKPGTSRSSKQVINIANVSECGTEGGAAFSTISEAASVRHEERSSTPNPFTAILNIHLISKEIYKHLSLADLLKFSLVDRFSNYCARAVLRENMKCLAVVRRNRMCRDLKDLDTLLAGSVSIPFNGLSIQPYVIYPDPQYADMAIHEHLVCKYPSIFYSNVLDKLNCKHVKISMWAKAATTALCPGHGILKKILKNNASHLESLSIKELPPRKESYSYYNNDDRARDRVESIYSFLDIDKNKTLHCFPKLKSLEIPCQLLYQDDASFVKELVLASPNIAELFGEISWKLVNFLISENLIHTVREFDFDHSGNDNMHPFSPYDNRFAEELNEVELKDYVRPQNRGGLMSRRPEYVLRKLQLAANFGLTQPQLTKLSISTYNSMDQFREENGRWFRSVSEFYDGILHRSSDTLEEITIYYRDFIFLIRMLEQQLPPVKLTKLKRLTINYCQRLEWTLTHINFYQWIPNVSSVSFKCDQYALNRHHGPSTYLEGSQRQREFDRFYFIQELYESSEMEQCDYVWPSVTTFTWDGSRRFSRQIFETFILDEELTKVYPNVRHVVIKDYHKLESVCPLLWTEWPELESIAFVELDADLIFKNFDTIFTGMTKKECDLGLDALRSGRAKDAMEIVNPFQTRPSIRRLTNLKTLRVEFRHGTQQCTSKLKHPTKVFLTEATKLFALELMPDLEFTILRDICNPPHGTQCRYSLEHLEPCVQLSSPGPEPASTDPPEPPVPTKQWKSKPRASKAKKN